jgi:hypothetical protein
MESNTRRSTRVPCSASGVLAGDTATITATVRNLSRGGSFVLVNRTLPVGQSVDLQIALPGIAPVRAMGEIRHHFRCSDGLGMGIRFTRLDGEGIAVIAQFVDAREANASANATGNRRAS